jgi:hypothetical protein
MEKEILDDNTKTEKTESKNSTKAWLKRIGVAGFLFFLIKGLVWIAVFAGMGKCIMG